MTGPLPRSGAGPRATDARAPSADASRGTPKLAPESSPAATAASGWRAGGVSERAAGLHAAFKAGDAGRAQALLDGGTAESNAALMAAYRGRYGRDLEYDLRGFASKGLSGAALTRAWQALHGPRLEQTAAALAQLTTQRPTADVRKAVYGHLALAGGEERAALAAAFQAKTGRSLTDALGPVFAAAQAAPPTFTSPPEKTVAIFVSSGNWKDVASGATDKPVGGYHWREVEGYVKEALDRGYTPVLFTPDGLPPSPDALSLLQGRFGPLVGFGVSADRGVDSPQGKVILDGFAAPVAAKHFDRTKFATVHIAGGHGSHRDLVGNPLVEKAAAAMHAQGKPVTAVCHATPALGRLLEGGRATGFSPQLDKLTSKAGYVLPEFNPTFDAHAALRKLGAKVGVGGTLKAVANPHHTETFLRDGVPIITGTGPEATDNVARQALDWLAR